jgi:hypothetical protein
LGTQAILVKAKTVVPVMAGETITAGMEEPKEAVTVVVMIIQVKEVEMRTAMEAVETVEVRKGRRNDPSSDCIRREWSKLPTMLYC